MTLKKYALLYIKLFEIIVYTRSKFRKVLKSHTSTVRYISLNQIRFMKNCE